MKKIDKGQSMFELLVAVSIASLILIAVVSLTATSVKNTGISRQKSRATRFAQEAMEFVRSERDSKDWNTFSSYASDIGKNYCLITEPLSWPVEGTCAATDHIPGTNFRRDLTMTKDGSDKVNITVVVRWLSDQGENTVTTSSTLTDWR